MSSKHVRVLISNFLTGSQYAAPGFVLMRVAGLDDTTDVILGRSWLFFCCFIANDPCRRLQNRGAVVHKATITSLSEAVGNARARSR